VAAALARAQAGSAVAPRHRPGPALRGAPHQAVVLGRANNDFLIFYCLFFVFSAVSFLFFYLPLFLYCFFFAFL
jgi:hypothetical protein